jgi:hypothetical protein
MVIDDSERLRAEGALAAEGRNHPRAVQARFDRRRSRVVIALTTGLCLTILKQLDIKE